MLKKILVITAIIDGGSLLAYQEKNAAIEKIATLVHKSCEKRAKHNRIDKYSIIIGAKTYIVSVLLAKCKNDKTFTPWAAIHLSNFLCQGISIGFIVKGIRSCLDRGPELLETKAIVDEHLNKEKIVS